MKFKSSMLLASVHLKQAILVELRPTESYWGSTRSFSGDSRASLSVASSRTGENKILRAELFNLNVGEIVSKRSPSRGHL